MFLTFQFNVRILYDSPKFLLTDYLYSLENVEHRDAVKRIQCLDSTEWLSFEINIVTVTYLAAVLACPLVNDS